jgi:hypothetical protein
MAKTLFIFLCTGDTVAGGSMAQRRKRVEEGQLGHRFGRRFRKTGAHVLVRRCAREEMTNLEPEVLSAIFSQRADEGVQEFNVNIPELITTRQAVQ